MNSPLLAVRQLRVNFSLAPAWPWQPPGLLRAVDEINFNLHAGETLGIVGESGSGKSTLARALVGLQAVSSGAISYGGHNLARFGEAQWRPLRREIQMVFQDPLSSLDPRMTVGDSIAEPLRSLLPDTTAGEREARVLAMMERTGLSADLRNRYPHQLSGGQCQRAGIARALVLRPKILICDEPVSALDVSVQAQIINLLTQLQREDGLTLMFIAHDLAVVRHISRRILVMYQGRVMEQAACEDLFARPAHPYTRALLASTPGAGDRHQQHAPRQPDAPMAATSLGCAFAPRCPMADEHCTRSVPHYRRLDSGSVVACRYAGG